MSSHRQLLHSEASLILKITLMAGSEGFSWKDRVHVYARMDHDQIAPRALLSFSPAGKCSPKETVSLRGYLPIGSLAEMESRRSGVFVQPEWRRLVFEIETKNQGNYLERVPIGAFSNFRNPDFLAERHNWPCQQNFQRIF